ncbi:TonB-dependent receptor [Aurantiacibacter xanthus]|uniref:TonB-dependent receptor n=1 Tax=Aurantiacibacter xanthus TaxID=1784712 RepID=A0A3A1P7L7_9SPHN|nr:TonB-dependent receptor [Aurantiacibacter xanthus]RIV84130.1 TonB-dependent receptor [Aurantiacibacter xanthus]
MTRSACRIDVSKIALAVTLAAVPASAFAQTGSGDERLPSNAIIVTAQRSEQNLQDVPVSLAVVSDEALNSRQINDLTSLAAAAPSLQVGTDSNFAVRGVGTLAFADTIDSSVAFALDEVNLANQTLSTPMLYDVARVEVLSGPQGLLFGKNASAGLLNIVTTAPRIGELSGQTDVELSTRDTPGANRAAISFIGKQTLNVPVSENSALRINALYANQSPPVTNITRFQGGTIPELGFERKNIEDKTNLQFKAKYLYEGDNGLSVYLIADYNEIDDGLDRFGNTFRELGAGSELTAAANQAGITPSPDNFINLADGGYFREIGTGGAQARVSYEFGSGLEISNIFAWRYYQATQNLDTDGTQFDNVNQNFTDSDFDQYSNELRLALPSSGRITGQMGLYYMESKLNQQSALFGNGSTPASQLPNFPFCVGAVVNPGPPPNCSVSNNYFLGRDLTTELSTKSYAGFGQLEFELSDTFRVFAGARVTHDQVDINIVQGQYISSFVKLGVFPGTFSDSADNTNFSWKIGGQFEPMPDLMIYGFFGRGYKGPGFNQTAIRDSVTRVSSIRAIDPETSDAFEIGLKSQPLDWLTFNASAFFTKFDNFQVQSLDTVLQTFVVQNAASVINKGVEISVIARPVDGLSINGGMTFLDAHYDSFPGAQCYTGQPDPSCAVNATFDAEGLSLPYSPKLTSTVQAIYEIDTGGDFTPFIEANWYHRSSINFLINQAPGAQVGAVDLLGASVGFNLGDKLRASIFCKNCTNEFVPKQITLENADSNAGVLSYTQRFGFDSVRQIGVSLRVNY